MTHFSVIRIKTGDMIFMAL